MNNVFYAPVTSDLVTEPLWARLMRAKACGKVATALLSLARGLMSDFARDADELCCVGISRCVGFDGHYSSLALC